MRTSRKIYCAAMMMMALTMISCGGRAGITQPGGDKLIWASHKQRPMWTMKDVESGKGHLIIVGVSNKYADEKNAREDAERNARIRAARFLETAIREHLENITAELGLTSSVLNPSVAARTFVEMYSQAVIQRARVEEFYIEQWKSKGTKEYYYRAYAKLRVPDSEIATSFKEYINQKRNEWKLAQEQIDRVNSAFESYWESKKGQAEELSK